MRPPWRSTPQQSRIKDAAIGSLLLPEKEPDEPRVLSEWLSSNGGHGPLPIADNGVRVVIAIPARRMQQDRLQAGHTIPPSRSGRQASERPPCCHKESAVAYLLPILAAWEPVERRRQLYVSETSS